MRTTVDTPRWALDWIILLVVAMLLVGLAFRVWRDRPGRDVNRWFAFQALILAAWVTGVAAAYSGVFLTFWMRWTFASAALFPFAFVGFTRVFPENTHASSKSLWVVVSSLSVALSAICLTTPWVAHSFVLSPEGLRRLPGPIYPAYAAFLPAATAVLLAIQIRRWRTARGRARLQLQYYIVGVLILAVGGFTTNLAIPTFTGRSTYSVLGPYFALAFLGLVAHSIIRHRLLDLRIVVSDSLTVAAAVMVSLLPAGALAIIFWPHFSGRFSRDEAIVGVVAVVSLALLTPPLRDVSRTILDRYVHRHRTNVRRILREASTALSYVLDLDRVVATILGAVRDVIQTEGVALYLAGTDEMRLTSSIVVHSIGFQSPAEVPRPVLCTAAGDPTAIILADDVDRAASRDGKHRDLDAALRTNEWALVAPLAAQGVLVGILVIGRKLSGDVFSAEDADAVSTLANHAASAVKNAQLYAEIAIAKAYIENIVTTISSGVIAVSADGRIVLFNPAAAQLIGITESQARDASIESLPQSLCDALRAALESPERRTYPQIAVSVGHPDRLAICTTAPLQNHAGHAVGAVAVFSDLTALRELDRERSRAERLAGLQILTQALAHEIANPLSPIKTLTRLLEHRGDDRNFIQEFRRIVTRELERIERLVARLRAVGRPQRTHFGRVDLRKAVIAAVEVLTATAEERKISLTFDITPAPLIVSGDQAEFEEMFLNLVKNAIEAIPDEHLSARNVTIDVSIVDSDAIARVTDTGCGFPETLVDQVFVPFVSTKPHGSGLGLAICASIVQRAGGHIRVANRQGGGGVVTVRLPLA